ncbi:MAG: preprotein translocase subunit SecA [Ignavibacteriales bacterium]|nr:preprotein translocase subunit SecA [Ignavibacteriales bacterium]
MLKFFSKLFGSKKEHDVSRLLPLVEEINAHYATLQSLSDDELRAKTAGFKMRIAEAVKEIRERINEIQTQLTTESDPFKREDLFTELESLEKDEHTTIKETLDEILPEAFAVVKDTCRRLVGQEWDVVGHKMKWEMIPYDVQLMGGIVQHEGKISEMATGEGKTLVAVAPMYLNALAGRGVHLVTVNDYLARRDSEWMGRVFLFHGMTVGCIVQNQNPFVRREQYNCDITYGTNNEFGFDYLRDNMVHVSDEMVQRGHYYAIVDEVDSVLIDEARTPLIISGPVEVDDHKFNEMKPRVERLVSTQRNFVAKIVGEAEKLLAEGKEKEAGILLLRGYRGDPKNKKLAKMFAEGAPKKLMLQTEGEYMAEQNKRMHEIDDELLYAVDEKNHSIDLTEKGREFLASGMDKDMFILPDIGSEMSALEGDASIPIEQKQLKKDELNKIYAERSDRIHTVRQLLRAYSLYEKDVEYVVTDDGKVQIVDEFTGRVLHGRRYSDGLHQAIEAKEGVKVERDTQTLATVTLQNYFRLYKKLAGMTGTAETESAEFFDIYKLDVVVIPTNKKIVRQDLNDFVYRTKREKFNAVIGEIKTLRERKQPVLVGTTSVEVSETISRMLSREKIPHNVLNAKQHQREAEIVANAGLGGGVTIATNMAGRGTDIKLGPGVVEAGGLAIVGTERHEARRIDRQLRGRAGRQGDPGMTRFYLSLEDDLMRLFGSDRVASIMTKLGAEEGEVIEHPMITRMIERAQKKVEENNFGIRKRLLEYDNVMNQQREVIYAKRRHALLGEHLEDDIYQMLDDYISDVVERHYDPGTIDEMKDELRTNLLIDIQMTPAEFQSLGANGVMEKVMESAREFLKRKRETVGDDAMKFIQKIALLQVIDSRWKEHLREMDDLKEGIYLRAYGQKDPILEYKSEAYRMFIELIGMINREALNLVFKLFPENQQHLQAQQQRRSLQQERMKLTHAASTGMGIQGTIDGEDGQPQRQQQAPVVQQIIAGEKVGRNDPCPCGSGKKYKQCHGKNA